MSFSGEGQASLPPEVIVVDMFHELEGKLGGHLPAKVELCVPNAPHNTPIIVVVSRRAEGAAFSGLQLYRTCPNFEERGIVSRGSQGSTRFGRNLRPRVTRFVLLCLSLYFFFCGIFVFFIFYLGI